MWCLNALHAIHGSCSARLRERELFMSRRTAQQLIRTSTNTKWDSWCSLCLLLFITLYLRLKGKIRSHAKSQNLQLALLAFFNLAAKRCSIMQTQIQDSDYAERILFSYRVDIIVKSSITACSFELHAAILDFTIHGRLPDLLLLLHMLLKSVLVVYYSVPKQEHGV